MTLPDAGFASPYIVQTNNAVRTITSGTFVPTITQQGTTTPSFVFTSGGRNLGWYTTIGDTIFWSVDLLWTGKSTVTGDLAINLVGLPNSLNTAGYRPTAMLQYWSGLTFSGKQLTCGMINNVNYVTIVSQDGTGGGGAFLNATGCATNGEIQVGGFYRTT